MIIEVSRASWQPRDYSVHTNQGFQKVVDENFLKSVYSSSSEVVLYERVVECTNCGLIYTSPRLKDKLIHQLYEDGADEDFINNKTI